MSINIVVLQGRLTADPEVRTTNSGKQVVSFTLAVDKKFSKNNESDFIPVVAWDKNATFISRYFKKGSQIALEGTITSRTYEDKNGKKQTRIEVEASHASFCGSKSESQQTAPSEDKTAQRSPQSVSLPYADDEETDYPLPF